MYKQNKTKKEAILLIRCSFSQKQIWEIKAAMAEKNLSQWVRDRLNNHKPQRRRVRQGNTIYAELGLAIAQIESAIADESTRLQVIETLNKIRLKAIGINPEDAS
ncbi:hypothetical protein [Merismopedia glauca]|uniref:Uncharacterized protein n=1 Tax=Merismopedia glauca CCAP 1448/3 TaxID=1296344 RepID=A0A2T1C3P1_9CYAN|nr:hypothetical protein [Merismopedia glauca]PSB02788.1 hypothetical protein C7B64_11590 [Merismopedia glauca CCAP 1448/3]